MAFAAASTIALAQDGGSAKMEICHFPPGNPENAHNITISENAWPAHEEHGDHEGVCSDEESGEQGGGEKITICHIPPGNPDNAHTIEISENAWPAHEAHNDTQGECPVSGGDGGDGGDGNETDGGDGNETDGGDGNETDGGDGNETDGGDGNETDGGDGGDRGEGDAPPAGDVDECRGPQNIQAMSVGTSIHVTWDGVEDADRYLLWRSTGDSRFDPLVINEAGDTEHTDDSVEVGRTYSYHVTAMVGEEELGPCGTAEATAIPNFPTVLAGGLASVLGIGAYAFARRRV